MTNCTLAKAKQIVDCILPRDLYDFNTRLKFIRYLRTCDPMEFAMWKRKYDVIAAMISIVSDEALKAMKGNGDAS